MSVFRSVGNQGIMPSIHEIEQEIFILVRHGYRHIASIDRDRMHLLLAGLNFIAQRTAML
jgi:hypothetical protein